MERPGRVVLVVLACMYGLALPGGPAWAQDPSSEIGLEPELTKELDEEPPTQWIPPLPDEKQFDWLQVRSGEWLRGEFSSLRNRRVTFDSDEFDEISLDWAKVTAFYLPRAHTFRIEGRTLQGTAEMRGDTIRIRTDDEVVEFSRASLVRVARGAAGELSYWFLKVRADLGLRAGNTDQADVSGSVAVSRESATHAFTASYRGIYSRVDGDTKAANQRASTAFNVHLSRRLFVTVPFAEFYSDDLQNLDARVTPGVAIGYEFVRNSWVEFESSIGGGYQYTRNESGSKGSPSDHDAALAFRSTLEFDLPRDIDFDTAYTLLAIPTDFDKTNHHLESVLSADIWGPLDFGVTFMWDRIEDPTPDIKSDGSTDRPKRDDFRILVGFGLDF